MGVSGSGKTEVGRRLATHLSGVFEDGDDFHSEEAKAKMRAGIPLTDDDRRPWYARMRARIEDMRAAGTTYVLACSALKAVYRQWLRGPDSEAEMRFVFLDGDFELIHGRMLQREGHYMPVSLLKSQFATLERPGTEVLRVSITGTLEDITDQVVATLAEAAAH
jgi:gluconokinase